MNTLAKKLVPLTVAALLAGCVSGPNFESPKTPDTQRFTTEQLPRPHAARSEWRARDGRRPRAMVDHVPVAETR